LSACSWSPLRWAWTHADDCRVSERFSISEKKAQRRLSEFGLALGLPPFDLNQAHWEGERQAPPGSMLDEIRLIYSKNQ
jgi:hypothetical protein